MIPNPWFLSFKEGFSFSVNIRHGESKKEPKDECHERERSVALETHGI